MNVKDSERMMGLLIENGYGPAESPDEADILIVNTCSVREKPENKVFGVLGRWKELKTRNPRLVMVVAGCVAQQMGSELLDKADCLDAVIGTQMIHMLPETIKRAEQGQRVNASEWLEYGDPELFRVPSNPSAAVKSFVSIMQGCDNHCAYCIVPSVRGRSVSREFQDVISEVRSLSDRGVKEVTLLGQNVNAYSNGGADFPSLLSAVADIPGIERVRFTTSHPKDLDEKTIRTMADNDRIMENFHLPVQAGSDRVLEMMNRKYDRKRYISLVDMLREAMPEIGITTDLIVGFPGETREDFEQTLDLLERVRYDETFSFRYSKRPGTTASDMSGQVPEEEKYERLYELQELQGRITEDKNLEEVGKIHEVLVEGPSKTGAGKYNGRSRTNRIVHFEKGDTGPGDIIEVRITKAHKHSLEGEQVKDRGASQGVSEEETCLLR